GRPPTSSRGAGPHRASGWAHGRVMIASRLGRWFSGAPPSPSPSPSWLLGGGLLVGYLALSETSYALVFPPEENAVFWMPSGLTLALFLRTPPALWPAWVLIIFLAETLTVLLHDAPLPVAVVWGCANSLMPLTGASLLRPPAGRRFELRRLR